MVCANPDSLVNRNGVLGIGPGALAVYYEKLGGRVIYFGKPYEDIYHFSLDKLSGIAARRILVIGDTIHDIEAGQALGARTVGCRYGFGAPDELSAPVAQNFGPLN